MPDRQRQPLDYEPVVRSPQKKNLRESEAVAAETWLAPPQTGGGTGIEPEYAQVWEPRVPVIDRPTTATKAVQESWIVRRGHTISYAGLLLFTIFLYFRPYELFSALSALSSMTFWIAILTLVAFIPAQLSLEGNITARPREVNLLLLLCLTAIASIPLAINPGEAYGAFVEYLKPVIIFIVIINVVRTEARLKILIGLSLAVSIVVSIGAISDFRTGALADNRVWGLIGNLFGNPNDLALHLATMVPLAVALTFVSRGAIRKTLYAMCALLMMAASVVTFSRGGFLGLVGGGAVLAWKLGRRNRLAMVMIVLVFVGMFALAPGGYGNRLGSIFSVSSDVTGSSSARQALLILSIQTALRHPLLGVGMGNFHIVSIHEQVSHNAYTQVATEMGMTAFVLYVLFIVTPLRRLRQIERETLAAAGRRSHFYYLAIGAQASLVAYMISSFFASVPYSFYVYYLVGYAVCLRRLYYIETSAAQELLKHAAENQVAGDRLGSRLQHSYQSFALHEPQGVADQ